ncbi:MAG TPA: hypothetical protein VID50_06575 [Candidatus Eisenbacteria bacterium]
MPKPRFEDAELLLRLYELRREPELRRARAYMLTEFNVSSWEDLRPHYLTGDELDRQFRMVTSYWDMVGVFVNRGLIDQDLLFDATGEDIVVWSKIESLIPGLRAQVRPTYLWNLERLAKRHKAWREASYPTAERVIAEGSTLRGVALRRSGSRKGGRIMKKRAR